MSTLKYFIQISCFTVYFILCIILGTLLLADALLDVHNNIHHAIVIIFGTIFYSWGFYEYNSAMIPVKMSVDRWIYEKTQSQI